MISGCWGLLVSMKVQVEALVLMHWQAAASGVGGSESEARKLGGFGAAQAGNCVWPALAWLGLLIKVTLLY